LLIERYWRIGLNPDSQDAEEKLINCLENAVESHLPAEVPFGFCLSGGMDSSSVLCLSREKLGQSDLHSFTAIFNEDQHLNEAPFALSVVEQVGAKPHWIAFDDRELVDVLPTVIRAHDEPFVSTSMVAEWFVMREASARGRRVMMDGQGSDELFGGYQNFFGFHFADLLRKWRFKTLAREIAAARSVGRLRSAQLMAFTARAFVTPPLLRSLRSRVLQSQAFVGQALAQRRHIPLEEGRVFPDIYRNQLHRMLALLPELLHSLDRNAMSHSIEARVPFLDHRVVEAAFQLPPDGFISAGRQKAALRRRMTGRLPDAVVSRVQKVSYTTPERAYFEGKLGELAADVFHSADFKARGWSNVARCQSELAKIRAGKPGRVSSVWRALCAELWAQQFLRPRRQP
jgi:asparagine synthase (glutamine-hydrolysing)